MKMNKNWLDQKWGAYTIATCSAVVLYLALSHLNLFAKGIHAIYGFVSPVFIGVVIAYVFDPLVVFIHKLFFAKMKSERLARDLSVLITIVFVILMFVVLLAGLIPQMANSMVVLYNNLGTYAASIQGFLQAAGKGSNLIDISSITSFFENMINNLTKSIPNNMDEIINTSFSIGKNAFDLIIGFIMAIYFLIDKKGMLSGISRLLKAILPEKRYRESADFFHRCNRILIRFIICDLLDGLIIGVANGIFMTVMGMPYVILTSVVVGVTNLAPTFGPIVGGVIGGFILVLVNPWYALWFIIFTIILQTCDGYVIKPKLFGDSLGVPAVWILISIIVGGRIFGVAGVLLAIPFAAIFDYVFREIIWVRINRKKSEESVKGEV